MTENEVLPPSYDESKFGFSTGQKVEGYTPQSAGESSSQSAGEKTQQGAEGSPSQLEEEGFPQGAGGDTPCADYSAEEYQPKSQPEQYGQPVAYGQHGPYGQPSPYGRGYMQPGCGHEYGQQTAQPVIMHQPGEVRLVVCQPRPRDYMAASIFACLCCFWPTAVCAICFACEANRLADVGDMAGATRMSNMARNLVISSIVLGIICTILVIYLYSAGYRPY